MYVRDSGIVNALLRPHWRLTHKRDGKSVSGRLPEKAAREIAASRESQQLSHLLLDVTLAPAKSVRRQQRIPPSQSSTLMTGRGILRI